MEVMQTIKEILKLNPFFKEQMQMILERTEIHESGKLADSNLPGSFLDP